MVSISSSKRCRRWLAGEDACLSIYLWGIYGMLESSNGNFKLNLELCYFQLFCTVKCYDSKCVY